MLRQFSKSVIKLPKASFNLTTVWFVNDVQPENCSSMFIIAGPHGMFYSEYYHILCVFPKLILFISFQIWQLIQIDPFMVYQKIH